MEVRKVEDIRKDKVSWKGNYKVAKAVDEVGFRTLQGYEIGKEVDLIGVIIRVVEVQRLI